MKVVSKEQRLISCINRFILADVFPFQVEIGVLCYNNKVVGLRLISDSCTFGGMMVGIDTSVEHGLVKMEEYRSKGGCAFDFRVDDLDAGLVSFLKEKCMSGDVSYYNMVSSPDGKLVVMSDIRNNETIEELYNSMLRNNLLHKVVTELNTEF